MCGQFAGCIGIHAHDREEMSLLYQSDVIV